MYTHPKVGSFDAVDFIWEQIRHDLELLSNDIITSKLYEDVLSCHCFNEALAKKICKKISNETLTADIIYPVIKDILDTNLYIKEFSYEDLNATLNKDPACPSLAHAFLWFKGFLALQIHRIAHELYQRRRELSFFLQSRSSELFGIDIHPLAKIGKGIFLDHAHSVVIGETTIIGNNVTILHAVTLGGRGNQIGDRHPKIGNGVSIGAGASVLGNVSLGDNCTVAAGAIVLKDLPENATAVGIPARMI